MAIPISEYINVNTRIPDESAKSRIFNGLAISSDEMKSGSSLKTQYDLGDVVGITKNDLADVFDDSTAMYAFANLYFGNGGVYLNVAKVLSSESALAAFNRIIGSFQNFGAFTFVGDFSDGTSGSNGLLDVANGNVDSGWLFVKAVTPYEYTSANAMFGISGTHVIESNEKKTVDSDDINIGAAVVLGWYADVDYNSTNASSSMDYKNVSIGATVDSANGKSAHDEKRINYVGQVQTHGFQTKFYQRGVNCDGVDIGNFRDASWIKAEVEAGWFNLIARVKKIPANANGAALVTSMIMATAERGCDNGVILIDKPLSADQIEAVNYEAGGVNAADSVQSVGYYINAKIVKNGNRYECQYTLIYAKGDHIGKVNGTHILV